MNEASPPPQAMRFYTEEELDALEEHDPVLAARIARAQAMAERHMDKTRKVAGDEGPPDPDKVREAVDVVRQILRRDGGDIELVEIQDRIVRVRMKGACVGCPNSTLDLKNVVSKIVGAVAGVEDVQNTF